MDCKSLTTQARKPLWVPLSHSADEEPGRSRDVPPGKRQLYGMIVVVVVITVIVIVVVGW